MTNNDDKQWLLVFVHYSDGGLVTAAIVTTVRPWCSRDRIDGRSACMLVMRRSPANSKRLRPNHTAGPRLYYRSSRVRVHTEGTASTLEASSWRQLQQCRRRLARWGYRKRPRQLSWLCRSLDRWRCCRWCPSRLFVLLLLFICFELLLSVFCKCITYMSVYITILIINELPSSFSLQLSFSWQHLIGQ